MKRKNIYAIYPIIMTALTYLPIIIVGIYSFNESKLSSVWSGFSLTWYRALFRDESMIEALFNSVFLGLVSSILAAVIATSAAIGIHQSKLPFVRLVEKISTLPMIIPEIVLGMVFLAFFTLIKLPFGMLTLILAHTAFCIPYIYMQVSARLIGMDKSVTEAARDLGASRFRTFTDVTLPYLMPSIVSGMFLAFAMSFDDVIISIFVTGVSVNTLPIKVYTQIKTGVTPKINALCTIMLAVTVLCYAVSAIIRHTSEKNNSIHLFFHHRKDFHQ